MSGEADCVATPSQTAGPFFHIGLPPQRMAAAFTAAERIRVLVTVTDGDGRPVDDALIEVWHTAETSEGAGRDAGARAQAPFARMPTGPDGTCELETVRPGPTPDGRSPGHAPHINVCVFARGLLRQLHTRIYFAGDPALESDAVLALVPEHRRATLLARPDPEAPGRWRFDVRLQEPRETVFFDV